MPRTPGPHARPATARVQSVRPRILPAWSMMDPVQYWIRVAFRVIVVAFIAYGMLALLSLPGA